MTAQVQQSAWRTAEADNTPMVDAEGDIFAPLRKVRQQYYDQANKLAQRLDEDYYEGDLNVIREYICKLRDAGDRVGALIPKEETVDAEPVASSEPVIQAAEEGTAASGDITGKSVDGCQDGSEPSLQDSPSGS